MSPGVLLSDQSVWGSAAGRRDHRPSLDLIPVPFSLLFAECGPGLSLCPAGGFKERFFTPLLVCLIFTLLLVIVYRWGHWRFNKRAEALRVQRAAAAASSGAATTQHAVELAVAQHPKLTLDISHVYVRVKDSEGKRSKVASSPSSGGIAAARGVAHDPTLPEVGPVAPRGTKTILHDITGTIRGGRLTAIMGPSGSGKSTFLNALLGKARVAAGSITVNHTQSVRAVAKLNVVGFVPQVRDKISRQLSRSAPRWRPRLLQMLNPFGTAATCGRTAAEVRVNFCAFHFLCRSRCRPTRCCPC